MAASAPPASCMVAWRGGLHTLTCPVRTTARVARSRDDAEYNCQLQYDSMGNVVKQTLALAEQPSPENSPITETSFGAESPEDGVYSITTTTRYNAAGQPLISVQKRLISELSPTQESKSVFVSERGLTSTQWTEYSAGTKQVQYSTMPGSAITAETVTVDPII